MKSLLFLFSLLLSTYGIAQYDIGGGGGFSTGYYLVDTRPLNDFALSEGKFAQGGLSLGGYGYVQLDRLVLGIKGYGLIMSDSEDDQYTYSSGGGAFLAELGFKIWNYDSYSIYPYWGAGIAGFGYNQSQKGEVDLTTNPNPGPLTIEYSWSSIAFDVGFRYEQLINPKEKCGQKKGPMVTFELGYQYTPVTRDWKTGSGQRIKGAPDFSLGSFFAKISFGGFGGK